MILLEEADKWDFGELDKSRCCKGNEEEELYMCVCERPPSGGAGPILSEIDRSRILVKLHKITVYLQFLHLCVFIIDSTS